MLKPETRNQRPDNRVRVPGRVRGVLARIGELAAERGLNAYAVGGCVRDWWLGRLANVDVDVTVEGPGPAPALAKVGPGITLARAAAEVLGGSLTAHEQFGTATLAAPAGFGAGRVDFATCRRETYAKPAAYPRVIAGTLEDDLFRRDFTINAMASALHPARFGALTDPFGGAGDLAARRLRILHDRSFLDDPTRILRGVRFLARFRLRWEPGTRRRAGEALRAGALSWLNPGRLQRELDRLLAEPDPVACLDELARLLDRSG